MKVKLVLLGILTCIVCLSGSSCVGTAGAAAPAEQPEPVYTEPDDYDSTSLDRLTPAPTLPV